MKLKILISITLLTTIGLTLPVQAENHSSFQGLLETQQCQECNLISVNQSDAREIMVTKSLTSTLTCVKSVLTERGESILKVDQKQGVVITTMRSVEPEELQQIANIKPGGGQISWKQGSYQLIINLSPVEQQRTKVKVSVRIVGSGETRLPLMRPSLLQLLPSTGRLERDILSDLASQCRDRANR